MIRLDEDALICDLAETYNIFDYKKLALNELAIFACGLRDDSRIKLKMSENILSPNQLLLAGIQDRLSLLVYSKTKDAEKGKNYPKLILDSFENKIDSFSSGEDFMKERERIMKEGKNADWNR